MLMMPYWHSNLNLTTINYDSRHTGSFFNWLGILYRPAEAEDGLEGVRDWGLGKWIKTRLMYTN